jgi:hypothetical protein
MQNLYAFNFSDLFTDDSSTSTTTSFDDETINNQDPGEVISSMNNITEKTSFSDEGALSFTDNIDAYYFTPGVAGTYTITLQSPDKLDMKGGKSYNQEDFFNINDTHKKKVANVYVDANQTLFLTIFNNDIAVFNNPYVLLIDFEPISQITISDANITEGNEGKSIATFTVSVDKVNEEKDISVSYQTIAGSAEDETGNNDFFSKSGTITIPKGENSTTIDIEIDGDYQDESDEQFYLVLSDPVNASIADGNATGTIYDDDDYDNTNHYNCETQAYIYTSKQVYEDGEWYFDTPTDLHIIDLTTAEDRLDEEAFYSVNINAIGYSVGDNFIWGYDPHNNKVTRTDANNNVISFEISGLPSYMYHIGDVSPKGVLYLASAYLQTIDGVESDGIKRMYRVDVNPNSHTFRKVLPAIDLSEQNLYSADWAFHPIDEQLYMVNRYDYDLIKIDPQTGEVKHLGNLLPYNMSDKGAHVQFFDRDGYFYFYNDEDFYRVDLKDPNNPALTVKKYTHLPLTANGDAARCAYAPMKNSFHIVSEIAENEGNSGTTTIPVDITLDSPAGAGGIEIDYNSIAQSATEGEDYQKAAGSIIIPAGESATTITLTLYGDTKVEDNESFILNVSSPTLNTEENSTVTIINDDARVITLNAVTSGSPFSSGVLTTQVVNRPFELILSAYDESESKPLADFNITKIDLVKEDGTFLQTIYEGTPLTTDSNGTVTTNITIGSAGKIVSLKIYGNYENHIYYNQAQDNFAVRPDHFSLSIPSVNIAGKPFTFNLRAEDYNGHPAANYNETVATSFKVIYKEENTHCLTGTIDLSSITFHNGVFVEDLNYTEAGSVDFNISEIAGQEFAIVDQNDTPQTERLISPANILSVKFNAAKLQIVDWSLQKPATNFIYFANLSDMDEMAAELIIHLKATDYNDNILQNYTAGCYAANTDLVVKFNTSGTSSQNDDLIWKDALHTDHDNHDTPVHVTGIPENQEFLFDVNADNYNNGETIQHILLNFKRDIRIAKEPVRLNIYDINATSSSLTTHLTKDAHADFYYGRLHATNNYTSGEELEVPIFHEVYCKKCDQSIFTVADSMESKDSVNWYIVQNYNDGVSTFGNINGINYTFDDIDFNNPSIVYSLTTNPAQHSNQMDKIEFKVPHTPFKDRITYEPKPWLRYNPFKITAKHSFNIQLNPKIQNWAGKGTPGRTVDINISQRPNNGLKLDW